MPIIDGIFQERAPLTLAERAVDFTRANRHIVERRLILEQQTIRHARRVALTVAELGSPSPAALTGLAQALEQGLRGTVRFGWTEARGELGRLRASEPLAAAYAVPDAGRYAERARQGLPGVLGLMVERALQVAAAVAAAAAAKAQAAGTADEATVAAQAAAASALHNHVLELVGEALNLGRTAGALSLEQPPEFALRSEQLDNTTCDPCTRLHGEITEVGSSAYFEILPPAECLGGGRCRGLMVFADRIEQVHARPEAA